METWILPFSHTWVCRLESAITALDWGHVMVKVAKRADPWMVKFMSSVARLTLINPCLSNLPLHAMDMCMLEYGVHRIMNKQHSRFVREPVLKGALVPVALPDL
jgi:hypothetical protein